MFPNVTFPGWVLGLDDIRQFIRVADDLMTELDAETDTADLKEWKAQLERLAAAHLGTVRLMPHAVDAPPRFTLEPDGNPA